MANINTSELADEKEPLILAETGLDTDSDVESDSESEKHDHEPKSTPRDSPSSSDPRFNQPPPSPFKRGALIIFTIILFWLALSMRKSLWTEKKSPKIVYATRYSKEHRFRPAASPIITETLKDGRIRIRGAGPTDAPSAQPTPPIAKKAKRKVQAKKPVKRAVRKPPQKK
ncbi:hypothetical protein FPV67DRAFT_1581873 [Lyophyllum atratum]|nr:hypothetical protein FPV67DRAFT_1581873 [Lyophyllum atratum]